MTKSLKHGFLLIPVIILIILAVYIKLPWQYFQQDEWHHLGQEYVWHKEGIVKFFASDVFSPVGVRFLPFGSLFNYLQFSLFGSNSLGYSVISLLLHITNTLLVYLIVRKLISRDRVAFLTALFWGVWASHQQAVTWLIQHSTTLPALTFSLLAIYFFLDSRLFFSFLSILTAIFFKETAYFLFPFLILLSFLRGGKIRSIFKLRSVWVVLATGIVYAVILVTFSFVQPKAQSEIFIPHEGFIQTIARRVFSIPLRVIAQSLFQESTLTNISRGIAGLPILKATVPMPGTPQFDIFVEQSLAKNLMYAIAFTAIVITVFVLKKVWKIQKYEYIKKGILISAMFILFGSFPLLFISTLAGNFTFIESRYLYIVDIGTTIILALFADFLIGKLKYLGWAVVAGLVFINAYFISTTLANQIEEGSLRNRILREIKLDEPVLPRKVVFYTVSDKSYYGLPATEKIMPFQSGFGEMLLVWYQPSQNFPVEFYADNYLWDIKSQNYKEIDGVGFGYYRDFDLLKAALKKYNLPVESVVAFSYDSHTRNLKDITSEIRQELQNGSKK